MSRIVMPLMIALSASMALNSFATAGEKSGEATAETLLNQARETRATWQDFPGFTADFRVNVDGQMQTGRIEVSASGDVSVNGIELPESARRSLHSLIAHRLPGSSDSTGAKFADDDATHPLGRLIRPEDTSAMASTYRVREGVLRQVNRSMGQGHFTISVLDVNRNAEGKSLPLAYTVSFWNKDGSLRSSSTTYASWKRVGGYDLPSKHATVASGGKDRLGIHTFEFNNHALLASPAAAE